MQKEYELSGKPGNIYIIGILVGSVVMFLCQYVYLLVNIAAPSFFYKLAVYGASLYLLFWVQKLVSRTGKCRGRTHAVICGFILGFIAVYLNMAIFAFLVISDTDDSEGLFVLLMHPGKIAELFQFFLTVARYHEEYAFNRGYLELILVTEYAGIVIASAYGGSRALEEQVFCENCNQWAEKHTIENRLESPDSGQLNGIIWEDASSLTELKTADSDHPYQLQLHLFHCGKCSGLHAMDIDLVFCEPGANGLLVKQKEDAGPIMLIEEPVYQRILAHASA